MLKYVYEKSDFPSDPHWAIITFRSIHIPGDERSRRNPGHGYPARTERALSYQAFLCVTAWEEEVKSLEDSGVDYVAVKVSAPALVERRITMKVRMAGDGDA